jgi:ABC-type transport system involved in multi-copper enzyme maturation permease subunit
MKSTLSPIWTIAKNTYREIVRDRLLYGILVVALLVTASSFFLGTISLGQDHRVIQNIGLASIHVFAVFICIFVASNAMYHDIERRALYLLLPKPISRAQYVLGKFAGLTLLLLTTLLLLGGLFILGTVFIDKSLILGALMVLSYSFVEISLLIALAMLFATFAAPLNASLYTLALFIIGHSTSSLKEYLATNGSVVSQQIVGYCYYLLPNLEKFDIRQAVLYNVHTSPEAVIWSLFYWVIYTGFLLGLTIVIMQNREV